jgi:hypothetical protein
MHDPQHWSGDWTSFDPGGQAGNAQSTVLQLGPQIGQH